MAEDLLFATLDPTMREIALPGLRQGDPVRHGRLHLRPADPARRRLPGDAGGGGRRPTSSSMSATSPIPTATPSAPTSSRCWRRSAWPKRIAAADRGLEQDRPARRRERAGLLGEAARREDVVALSALTGEGVDDAARGDRRTGSTQDAQIHHVRAQRRRRRRGSPGSMPVAKWSSSESMATRLQLRGAPVSPRIGRGFKRL